MPVTLLLIFLPFYLDFTALAETFVVMLSLHFSLVVGASSVAVLVGFIAHVVAAEMTRDKIGMGPIGLAYIWSWVLRLRLRQYALLLLLSPSIPCHELCGKVGDGVGKGRRRISGGVSQPHIQQGLIRHGRE